MLRVLALVASIALADAVNPATLAPALYLAAGSRPRARVLSFGAAFFAVNLLGGVLIVLGPGRLLLSLLPHMAQTTGFVLELAAGVLLVAAGAVLLARRRAGGAKEPRLELGHRGAGALGATIALVELPTAFPYFAALAAIVGSGQSLPAQLLLIGVFNVVFISPALAVVAALAIAGDRARASIEAAGAWLRARWWEVLAGLALVAGTLLALLGTTGLLGLR